MIWRVRLIVEGPGLQLSGMQERVDTTAPGADYPDDPINMIRTLLDHAGEHLAEAWADAIEAELEHANRHGSVPAGRGFRPPETLAVIIEPIGTADVSDVSG